jgi:hypothetical protein
MRPPAGLDELIFVVGPQVFTPACRQRYHFGLRAATASAAGACFQSLPLGSPKAVLKLRRASMSLRIHRRSSAAALLA